MYRAVGNRCAIDSTQLNLPIDFRESMGILLEEGFTILEVNMMREARGNFTKKYRRGALIKDAPLLFDCSSFVKWLYGLQGIWLPRRSIQQYQYCCQYGKRIPLPSAGPGDLVFAAGSWNWVFDTIDDGVGHVGVVSDGETIIHATNRLHPAGIKEETMEGFVTHTTLRGVYRIVPDNSNLVTLMTPPRREIETSDDIRYIILEYLSSARR